MFAFAGWADSTLYKVSEREVSNLPSQVLRMTRSRSAINAGALPTRC